MIKSIAFSSRFLFILIVHIFLSQSIIAQSYILNNDTSFLEVHGTSSLHDWHVDAREQSGNAEISFTEILEINNLNFSVVAESLKSGKSSMDKNTYKALKTDSYTTIEFKLTKIQKIDKTIDNTYAIKAFGEMTITGITNTIPIDFKAKFIGRQLLIEGEKSMKMTDYGITPPKALFGTIKTGDEINIVFKAVYETTM